MQINVKHRKAQVSIDHRLVNRRFDPVEQLTIEIVRNDGFIFVITWFYDWMIRCPQSPHLDESGVREKELKDILKQHNLPSIEWITEQYEVKLQAQSEDPLGRLADYV